MHVIKKRSYNIVLVLFGSTIALVLSEVFLRITDFSYPSFYRVNNTTWTEHYPNAEGWHRVEGNTYVKINSHGLYNPEITVFKPKNTIRIAVLGDSFAEAFQVPMKKAFWSILQSELNKCKPFGNNNIQVINFGVSGYGTGQELIRLRTRVWQYEPDIILLTFYAGNNVRNNSSFLDGGEIRPYFIQQNGTLILDNSFRNSKSYKKKTSILWESILFTAQYSRFIQLINKFRHGLYNYGSNYGDTFSNPVFFPPNNKGMSEAWSVTEKLILLMRNEVQQKGSKFLLVTLSIDHQVLPDKKVIRKMMEDVGLTNPFYPDERIEALAKKHNIPHLILAPKFADYAQKHGVFLHGFENSQKPGFGHWNTNGHRLGGQIMGRKICNGILSQENSPS